VNNYEYIIAGLPLCRLDTEKNGGLDSTAVIEDIRTMCGDRDRSTLDFLLDGFVPDNLLPDFYLRAEAHSEAFIRDYFRFDRNVRNAKVRFLNKAVGRPEGQDVMILSREEGTDPEVEEVFEEAQKTAAALAEKKLLDRERALDSLYWDKVEEMVMMEVFSLPVILAFVVKLKISERWMILDPERGKELLRQLVEEIRKTKEEI